MIPLINHTETSGVDGNEIWYWLKIKKDRASDEISWLLQKKKKVSKKGYTSKKNKWENDFLGRKMVGILNTAGFLRKLEIIQLCVSVGWKILDCQVLCDSSVNFIGWYKFSTD